ncbi:MAG: aminoacyl-histidine dipeptidase [Bacteroidota bacterium]|nr:aminoacyl-histidine dipeptidase [Bacteroidota bacterium]
MQKEIAQLEPKEVWKYFLEIAKVPRPSKKEEKIIKYLLDFAKKNNLDHEQDEIGNVLIRKAATNGSKRTVVLQSHMDMVCEKNADIEFDFDNDAIQPIIKDGWIKAQGTTLGADDSIGMAAELALLVATDIEHPALECLFTVDEETGLTGAFGLKPGFLKGDILLNLDSEDDGELFIGCAGGIDTLIEMPFTTETTPNNHKAFKIKISGLQGGHSGDDIQKGRGNANKILSRILWNGAENLSLRFNEFNAGNLRNAIAREGSAIVTIPAAKEDELKNYIKEMDAIVKDEFHNTDAGVTIEIENTELPATVVDLKSQKNLLNSLYSCPHGVIAWSQDIDNFVETSTNLAAVKTKEDHFYITTSQRSSVTSAKDNVKDMVTAAFKLTGSKIISGEGYPGWAPNPNSEIVKITEESYEKLFSTKPKVLAIHAGLECGLIGETYPNMDMISFGPDIRGAHSPAEAINIETVAKFWALTLDVLKKIK